MGAEEEEEEELEEARKDLIADLKIGILLLVPFLAKSLGMAVGGWLFKGWLAA